MLAAARIIGVESTTLGKAVALKKNGLDPKSNKKSVWRLAELFASGKPVTEVDAREAALLDGPPPSPWPHPSEVMTASRCASALGITPKTMNTAVKNAEAGINVPGRVGACAAVFAKLPPAYIKKALCLDLMNAAGANLLEAAPEEKKRVSSKRPQRPGKRVEAMLARITATQRQDAYNEAVAELLEKETETGWDRLTKVVVQIRICDGQDAIEERTLLCRNVRKLGLFATLDEWIARATPKEQRIFLVFEGRPYDYSTAPEKVLVGGRFKAMVLAEFAKMVLDAAESEAGYEAAEAEGKVIEGEMSKGKKPKGRRIL